VIKLVLIPVLDMSQFNFELALPTKQNTYGYRWYSKDNPQYSHIDIAVAGIESYRKNLQKNIQIKNLQEWFLRNKYRESENIIPLGIVIHKELHIKTITEWKYYLTNKGNEFSNVSKILKSNGPLTFKELM
jgi:hypothetical protein